MPTPPACESLGRQCRELDVTLRIAEVGDDSQTLQDAAATWLLGHTERLTFGRPYVRGDDLLVRATVHVPCKHLKAAELQPNGRQPTAQCAVYGFQGRIPESTQASVDERPQFRRSPSRYQVYYKRRIRILELPLKRAAQRALPVLQTDNPCFAVPCRTADNKQGSACCRDLSIDVVAPKADVELEALLRSRKSPYLCKVTREHDSKIECEVISACGYLDDDGVGCVLHDRSLPNGRGAKPSICYEWPDLGPDDTGHPGCAFL